MQLSLLPPETTTGTCRHCGQTVPTFLYDAKAPAPWWYACEHQLDGERCPRSGYPVAEQERPQRDRRR